QGAEYDLSKSNGGKCRQAAQNREGDHADGNAEGGGLPSAGRKSPQSAAHRAAGDTDAAGDNNRPAETLSPTKMRYGREILRAWWNASGGRIIQRQIAAVTNLAQPRSQAIAGHMAENRKRQKGDRGD